MTAPSVASVGTINSGTGTTRTPGVPSGISGAGFWRAILVGVNANGAGGSSGFSDLIKTASPSLPNINIHYGLSAGAESGTYSVTVTSGLNNADTQAARFNDVGGLFGTVSSPAPANSATPVATSLANVPANSLLVWMAYSTAIKFSTMPTGFTRQSVNGQVRHHWGTMVHDPGGTGVSDVTVNTGQFEQPAGTPSSVTHRVVLFAITPIPPNAGTFAGNVASSGTMNGSTVHRGTVAGAVASSGSAGGSAKHAGTVAGTVTTSGSASGSTTRSGSFTGSVTTSGSASGSAAHSGSFAGSVTSGGTAGGTNGSTNAFYGTVTTSGAFSGSTRRRGSTSGTVTTSGAMHGSIRRSGSVSGSVTTSGTMSGRHRASGMIAGNVSTAGVVIGRRRSRGSISGHVTSSGTMVGRQRNSGTFYGTVTSSGHFRSPPRDVAVLHVTQAERPLAIAQSTRTVTIEEPS